MSRSMSRGENCLPGPEGQLDKLKNVENWVYNKMFAQLLSAHHKQYLRNGESVHEWVLNRPLHVAQVTAHAQVSAQSHLVLTTHLHVLMNTITTKDDNLPGHLKHYWDHSNFFADTICCMSEFLSKCIQVIASSLLEFRDHITNQFIMAGR